MTRYGRTGVEMKRAQEARLSSVARLSRWGVSGQRDDVAPMGRRPNSGMSVCAVASSGGGRASCTPESVAVVKSPRRRPTRANRPDPGAPLCSQRVPHDDATISPALRGKRVSEPGRPLSDYRSITEPAAVHIHG